MPTNYDGDRTATQAPSDPPGPDGQITVALIADGDDVDASTSEQKDKAVADWIDWIYNPHSVGDPDSRFLRRYRTVQGHTRWALDRNGFPAATFMHWQEMWCNAQTITGTTPAAAVLAAHNQGWIAVISGAAGTVSVAGDTVKTGLALKADDDLGDYSYVNMGGMPAPRTDLDLVLEASIYIQDNDDVEHIFGLVVDSPGFWPGDLATNEGLFFILEAGAGNWKCAASGPVSETYVALGGTASIGSFVNLRIEYRGSGVSDDSTSTAYFYVGGTLVGTITTNLPSAGTFKRALVMGSKNTTGDPASAQRMVCWAVNVACNWIPAVTT